MAHAETLVESRSTRLVLEPGDHLSRAEFERCYEAMPGLKKAELLEGIVYMPSPVRIDRHGRPHIHVSTWLGTYEALTPGVLAGDNVSVRLDEENMPQPDAAMMIESARGGQATVSADGYIEGGPELVVEIAASTVSIDLHTKLRVYLRNQVREYIAWRVLDRAVDWFVLRQGQYDRLAPGGDGIVRSEVFPGLWLDPVALVGSDLARVLEVLRLGLASAEHAGFVARLNPVAG